MSGKLAQIITDLKSGGVWEHIVEPDGALHPNNERALLEGCTFDLTAAERVMQFYVGLLQIPWDKGTQLNEWERGWIKRYARAFNCDRWQQTKPFVLLQWWYERVIRPLFGWKRPDGRRRFDKGFVTTAKKSGKSSTLAGLPLYMTLADEELESEAYSAATMRDQAGLIYEKVDAMVRRSPRLDAILRRITSKKRVVHEASSSWFEAISSEADSAEGKNPHLLIVDELHAWRDRRFFDALMYGDIRRTQPLFLMITTAGDDVNTVGYEEYEFARDLLDPNSDFYSMSHFAFIAESGRNSATGETVERTWDDPAGWSEANPSIAEGVGSIEKLQSKCNEARQTPTKKRSFIRYICNRWVHNADDAWLDVENWRACGVDRLPTDHGAAVWLGIDLSSVRDITAVAMAWHGDNAINLKVQCFIPSEGMLDKEQLWRVPLRDWVEQGWVTATPGASLRYDWIRKYVSGVVDVDESGQGTGERDPESIAELYAIEEIAYDRWNAHKLIETELGDFDGLTVAEHGQGFAGMSPACKEFEARVADRTLRHDNNPVMDWMVRNAIADQDPASNIKLNKKKSRQKIDGLVAAVMAVGRANISKPKERSVYERRGVLLV